MDRKTILTNRLKKNYARLKAWLAQEKIQAYRIYEKDIPEIPYIIDIYQDYALVYEKGKSLESIEDDLQKQSIEAINTALGAALGIQKKNIIYKRRYVQTNEEKYQKMTNTETILQDITEGPAHFIINLTDYLDTGIFLDHRPLRKIIYKNSQNKNVLNLFSYTGTISVMAALGGGKVWSVDLSNSYTNWAYDNFRLNNITFADHHFITEDTFTFLKESTDLFDLIILDPPTFSNSKKFEGTLDIQRDHEKLIELCISRLTNAGTLYFSNNLRTFKLNPNLFEKYYIKDISLKTIPADFRDTKIHQCFEIKQK